MEHAADILKQIETPLELAGLAMLVFYGIAQALIASKRWKPSDAIVKLFLNRAFALGLIVLILGMGGPLVVQLMNPDEFIEGSVYAQGGAPIGTALVSVIPVGSQAVHLDGSFEFRVPEHLKRPQYVITATADGYKPDTKTVAKAGLSSVDFQLQAQPEHTVREIMSQVSVGQLYGLPVIVVSMQVKNPGAALVFVTDIAAQLSNGTVNISLQPQMFTILGPLGPFASVSGPIPINPGMPLTLRVVLGPNGDVNGLGRSIAGLPEYHDSPPCSQSGNGSPAPLTDRAFGMVQSFAQDRFVWSAGSWTLHFKVTAGGQEDTFDKTFQLSPADVQLLHDSIKLAKSCLSVNVQFPLAQDGPLSNYIVR